MSDDTHGPDDTPKHPPAQHRPGEAPDRVGPDPPLTKDPAPDTQGASAPQAPDRRREMAVRWTDKLHETADNLLRDDIDLGEVKLLVRSTAELHEAFRHLPKWARYQKVCVFGSARTRHEDPLYQQAVHLGEIFAEAGFMVITGAGPGIMEAAHEGSGSEMAVGFNIDLPFEQSANPIIDGDEKLFEQRYFFTRKLLFLKESDAIICFPGGFGTLDETFETLTMIQTGKCEVMPLILVDRPGGTYWHSMQEFVRKELAGGGMISESDFRLYTITDSVEATLAEVQRFYRVYHSQRYVRGVLYLRLKKRLPDDFVARLNDEFADVLTGSDIRQRSAHGDERHDAAAAGLPRLTMRFDRKSHGRLREMIDLVNEQ